MVERDGTTERGRKHEEDYFRKRDRELIERMRQAAAAEQAQKDLQAKTGLEDPELLRDLQELGFEPDTVALLPLVPVLQVAWAEGGVSPAERKLIVELARSRGIEAGGAADRQLTAWLDRAPAPSVFERATRLIRAMLDRPGPAATDLSAEGLIKYAESIASASGGMFGIGRVSAEERRILENLASKLKKE